MIHRKSKDQEFRLQVAAETCTKADLRAGFFTSRVEYDPKSLSRVCPVVVLAQVQSPTNPLELFAREFQQRAVRIESDYLLSGLLVILGVLLVFWFLGQWFDPQRRWLPRNSPLRLFLGLCRVHRLNWSETFLLWQIAKSLGTDDPCRIFVEPELLEAVKFRPGDGEHAKQWKQLKYRLFGELSCGPSSDLQPLPAGIQAGSTSKTVDRYLSRSFLPSGGSAGEFSPSIRELPPWPEPPWRNSAQILSCPGNQSPHDGLSAPHAQKRDIQT